MSNLVQFTMKNSSIRFGKPCNFEKLVVTDFCKSWNLTLSGISKKNTFSFYTKLPLEQVLNTFNESILLSKFDIIV